MIFLGGCTFHKKKIDNNRNQVIIVENNCKTQLLQKKVKINNVDTSLYPLALASNIRNIKTNIYKDTIILTYQSSLDKLPNRENLYLYDKNNNKYKLSIITGGHKYFSREELMNNKIYTLNQDKHCSNMYFLFPALYSTTLLFIYKIEDNNLIKVYNHSFELHELIYIDFSLFKNGTYLIDLIGNGIHLKKKIRLK
jgi:hypothetical protein